MLDKLPVEITVRIFLYLKIPDLLRLSVVNSKLKEISNSDDLWKLFVKPEYRTLTKKTSTYKDLFIAKPRFRQREQLTVDQAGKNHKQNQDYYSMVHDDMVGTFNF